MADTHNQPNEEISHVEPDDIGVGMLTVLGTLCGVVAAVDRGFAAGVVL